MSDLTAVGELPASTKMEIPSPLHGVAWWVARNTKATFENRFSKTNSLPSCDRITGVGSIAEGLDVVLQDAREKGNLPIVFLDMDGTFIESSLGSMFTSNIFRLSSKENLEAVSLASNEALIIGVTNRHPLLMPGTGALTNALAKDGMFVATFQDRQGGALRDWDKYHEMLNLIKGYIHQHSNEGKNGISVSTISDTGVLLKPPPMILTDLTFSPALNEGYWLADIIRDLSDDMYLSPSSFHASFMMFNKGFKNRPFEYKNNGRKS